jgi:hypothetical protein
MAFHLDPESRKLLSNTFDGSILGVVRELTSMVTLFRVTHFVSLTDQSFPGHRELAIANHEYQHGYLGFSFAVKSGKLSSFYRNSVFNSQKPLYCLVLTKWRI